MYKSDEECRRRGYHDYHNSRADHLRCKDCGFQRIEDRAYCIWRDNEDGSRDLIYLSNMDEQAEHVLSKEHLQNILDDDDAVPLACFSSEREMNNWLYETERRGERSGCDAHLYIYEAAQNRWIYIRNNGCVQEWMSL